MIAKKIVCLHSSKTSSLVLKSQLTPLKKKKKKELVDLLRKKTSRFPLMYYSSIELYRWMILMNGTAYRVTCSTSKSIKYTE